MAERKNSMAHDAVRTMSEELAAAFGSAVVKPVSAAFDGVLLGGGGG